MFPLEKACHYFRASKYIERSRHLVSKIGAARKILGIIYENEIRKDVGRLLNQYKCKVNEPDTTLQQPGQRCVRSAQRVALHNIKVDKLVSTFMNLR